jgi:hypothetical protein
MVIVPCKPAVQSVLALCKLLWCQSPDLHPACCVFECDSAPSVKPCLSSMERLLEFLPDVLPRTVHVQYRVEREYTIYTLFGLKITNTRLTKEYGSMLLFALGRRHVLCLYESVRKGFCHRDSWCSDTGIELYSVGTVLEPGPC